MHHMVFISRISFVSGGITELGKDWILHSSLHQVEFSQAFEIAFVMCGCALHFPGSSVQDVDAANDVVRLVKISSQMYVNTTILLYFFMCDLI
jgi:hypothetical protein